MDGKTNGKHRQQAGIISKHVPAADRVGRPWEEEGGGARRRQYLKVQGVVLAGIHCWEQGAFERVICRPLIPIASRPLIFHVSDWLRAGRVNKACICGNSQTGILRRHLGDGRVLDLSLEYVEDLMPRGPAGCVRDAAIGLDADVLLVIEGGVLPALDAGTLLEDHRRSGAGLTMVVHKGAGRTEPGQSLRPAGIYVLSTRILSAVPKAGYQDIKEGLIPELHRRGERVVLHTIPTGASRRVSGPGSCLSTNMWAVDRIVRDGPAPAGYRRERDAWIAESAILDSTARVVGPVMIGPGSRVGPDAMIIGPTSLGIDCEIGRGAVISRSAIWNRCTVGGAAVVDHSLLADDVQVAADHAVRTSFCLTPERPRGSVLRRVVACFRTPQDDCGTKSPDTAILAASSVPAVHLDGGKGAVPSPMETGSPC